MALYDDWSHAIGSSLFNDRCNGRVVYLAVDEEVIRDIGVEKLGMSHESAFENFLAHLRAEVRECWFQLKRGAGKYPGYLAALAAQVVAASQMRVTAHGPTPYWSRLRRLLGEDIRENCPPEGLDRSHHLWLWQDFRRWANQTREGAYGIVQLADRPPGTHRHVAEPIGQCLLRRKDLDQIRRRLAHEGQGYFGSTEAHRGHLRRMIRGAWRDQRHAFFTRHSSVVLGDPDREQSAWGQIDAEIDEILARPGSFGPIPTPTIRSGPTTDRPGASDRIDPTGELSPKRSVLLAIHRGALRGAEYEVVGGRRRRVDDDLAAILKSCARRLYEWRTIEATISNAYRLVAVWDEIDQVFKERKKCGAGDETLLLVHRSDVGRWSGRIPRGLLAGGLRVCHWPGGSGEPGWYPMPGVPENWALLRFRLGDDLAGLCLLGEWAQIVDQRGRRLQAGGGLRLSRGVYMAGFGPTLRVPGAKPGDPILVNESLVPLDSNGEYRLGGGAGNYRVKLLHDPHPSLWVRLREPRRSAASVSTAWHRRDGSWPEPADERRDAPDEGPGTLQGATLRGGWPPVAPPGPVPMAVAASGPDAGFVETDADEGALALALLMDHRAGRARWRLEDLLAARRAAPSNPLLRAIVLATRPWNPGPR